MIERFKTIFHKPDEVFVLGEKEIEDLIFEAGRIIRAEKNLITLKDGKVIFVGDTHGDLDATRNVISKYLNSKNKVVFLGDYVDRGPNSMENINFLLISKILYPKNLLLLQGNHEGRGIIKFYPADFWEGLSGRLYSLYSSLLSKLPLAAITKNGIIALHGALPNVFRVEEINEIEVGSDLWREITWGDFREREGKFLGDDPFTRRPQFGRGYFQEIMDRLGMNVLIRSHQPDAEGRMYGGRCLTIFTSHAYLQRRTIAISNLKKEVRTVEDLEVLEV
ncbi:MAG: hypothetical protein EF807_05900 [Candidatus Methanolliviera hydrocarbonicum]|uniref:Serine/threonine specific protein phosphatases domain-containing protein n=1 Tax=Candidatus Methanolliviera hydrocarbonicum TaxID=2491085 RepID=A0A520KWA4_9EURY|nr:MAG: hypothetical protein EF807_05900 [Candidatus Methanolliviera hydrocarbonicum]